MHRCIAKLWRSVQGLPSEIRIPPLSDSPPLTTTPKRDPKTWKVLQTLLGYIYIYIFFYIYIYMLCTALKLQNSSMREQSSQTFKNEDATQSAVTD